MFHLQEINVKSGNHLIWDFEYETSFNELKLNKLAIILNYNQQ